MAFKSLRRNEAIYKSLKLLSNILSISSFIPNQYLRTKYNENLLMILAFVAQFMCWLGGTVISYHAIPNRYPGRIELAAGLGWPISQVVVLAMIYVLPIKLSIISIIAVAFFATFSILAISNILAVFFRKSTPKPLNCLNKPPQYQIAVMIIGSIIGMHLWITSTTELGTLIFPWDAFTTWMYRAKAWVFADQIIPLGHPADWLGGDLSEHFAIYANKYPIGVSALAAFSSSFYGGWDGQAAVLPWIFVLIASGSIVFGLCRTIGLNSLTSLFAAYLTVSCPIVATHATLAGYADIWMLLFSGCGLACILASRLVKRKDLLIIGFVFLLVATQLKWEGWIWLFLSIGFCLFDLLTNRFGYAKCSVSLLAFLLFLWTAEINQISIGPLGVWGLNQERIALGLFGDFELRLYNPAFHYWKSLFQSPNFQILATLLIGSLMFLSLREPKKAVIFWLMFVLIALSQWVIFGVSVFSFYAETGTAINRLLLQFVPVATLTVAFAADLLFSNLSFFEKNNAHKTKGQKSIAWQKKVLLPGVLLIASLVLSLALTLSTGSLSRTIYLTSQMEAKIGSIIETEKGTKFLESPMDIGVIGTNVKLDSSTAPRFIRFQTDSNKKIEIAFYWINKGDPMPHLKRIYQSGITIFDTNLVDTWGKKDIVELGFIVPNKQFDATSVTSIELVSNLNYTDLPAIINTWIEPHPFNHTSINSLKKKSNLNPSFQWIMSMAAGLLIIVVLMSYQFRIGKLSRSAAIALMLLWVISDAFWLYSHAKTTRPGVTLDGRKTSHYYDSGQHLRSLTEKVNYVLEVNKPIIILPADAPAKLDAERMPFELLPTRAISIEGGVNSIPKAWDGYILIIARNSSNLDSMEVALSRYIGSEPKVELSEPAARLLIY